MIRLAIIEDDTIFLMLLFEYLKKNGLFSDIACYDSMDGFLTYSSNEPQIVLLDIGMPGMDGLEGAIYIKEKFPDARILMLTSHEDEENVFKAFQAGTGGYILKSTPIEKITAAIFEVFEGGIPMSPVIARMLVKYFAGSSTCSPQLHLQGLTQRELETSRLLNNGLSYKQVAFELKISMDTVRSHVKNIYRKLQINSRTELMRDYHIFREEKLI